MFNDKLNLLLILIWISVGCSQISTTPEVIDGIYETTMEDVTLPDRSVTHPVFVFSKSKNPTKPPVLLLHELPGLSEDTIKYARSLAENFTVYVPLLFGFRDQDFWPLGGLAYIFNGEWWKRDELRGSLQITEWLRYVLKNIEQAHSDPKQKISIIGMCLTGALPLALLDNDRVHAVVVAQPTLPLLDWSEEDKFSLGLSIKEWDKVLTRIDSDKDLYVYGIRFEDDDIADREKHTRLNEVLNAIRPGSFFDREICKKEYETARIEESAHSTLIVEWKKGNDVSVLRRQEITSFFSATKTFNEKDYTPAKCSSPSKHP